MRYYSPSTGSTYLQGLHATWPADAILISDETYQKVIANPVPGMVRSHDKKGQPFLMDAPAVVIDVATAIAAERYKREIGGIVLNGMRVDTDDRSKTLISGSALRAMRDPDYVLRWKTSEGFVDLTAAQVLQFADAVSAHVQACFDRESQLIDAVAAGTYTDSMLTEGWPA